MKLSVRKSNELVEVGENLSKGSKLLVLYLIAMMPEGETTLKEMEFSFEDIKSIVNIDGKKRISTFKEAEAVMEELARNPLNFENTEYKDIITWFSKLRFYKKTKRWNFIFHDQLSPYLLELKSHFTMYNFWHTVCLSAHGIKFYELLKRHEFKGHFEMSIEKQKYILGIEDKYKDKEGNTIYYEYKRWVLDKIQKEIALYTDINFEYKAAKKQGRRIMSHQFIIRKNIPQNVAKPKLGSKKSKAMALISTIEEAELLASSSTSQTPVPITSDQDIMETLQSWGGRKTIIDSIVAEYGIDKIQYQIKHAQRIQKEKAVKNLFGWFKKAVEEDYRDPVQEEKVKTAVTKARRIEWNTVKKAKEENLKILKSNKYQEEKALVAQLFADTPTLLEETIIELEKSSKTIRNEIQKGRSPETIFKSVRTQGFIINAIKKDFPKLFQSLELAFHQKKVALEE